MDIEKQRNVGYVESMVQTLINRHYKRLQEITPALIPEDIIRASGIPGIAAALDEREKLMEAVHKAEDAFDEASRAFALDYHEQIGALEEEHESARTNAMIEKQRNFEFRIRKAIGLVELVSSVDAFDVLEECRNEIEELDQ